MSRGFGKTQIEIIEVLSNPASRTQSADQLASAIFWERLQAMGAPPQNFIVSRSQIITVRRALKALEARGIVKLAKTLVYSDNLKALVVGWRLTGKLTSERPKQIERTFALRRRRASPKPKLAR